MAQQTHFNFEKRVSIPLVEGSHRKKQTGTLAGTPL